MFFDDRVDAGRKLAARLAPLKPSRPVIVALPRGGVPVAYEVARALAAPLDVLIARKLGAPGHAEFGIGAVAQGGASYLDERTLSALRVPAAHVEQATREALREVDRRLAMYRGSAPPLDVRGRVVVLVDDGLATGVTTRAAARALRAQRPERVVLAVPVCAPDSLDDVRGDVDEVVCLAAPEGFRAVGQYYKDFDQTSDEEVMSLLDQARGAVPARAPGAPLERAVRVDVDGVTLDGTLTTPSSPRALVVFAHGSGSGRRSPRNRFVAEGLHRVGVATLLIDLLTVEEEEVDARTRRLRFDVPMLARRLVGAVDWAASQPSTSSLPVGLFGASTGAGAALLAAAARPERVRAVVSRGGRPDLADSVLDAVRAPTLLIVGGGDGAVLALNEQARERMQGEVALEVIPHATHLFEEPGALARVSQLTTEWFESRLARGPSPSMVPAPRPERRTWGG
ncbi:MAG: alpha/beta family hydrolase [Polyangiales bacterium]